MRGRKAAGPEVARRLKGVPQAKQRLETILRIITGELGVEEAAAQLGITPQWMHVLREQALYGSVEALTPAAPGRPRKRATAADERIAVLEQEVARLRRELAASKLREEVAVLLPRRSQRLGKKRDTASRDEADERRR